MTPLLSSLTILILAATTTPAAADDSLSPPSTPCSANLGFNASRVPFNTSSLLCTNVWKAQGFVLMYWHSGNFKTWSFVLSAPNTGSYIGIGFSKDGKMVGSSAVVGWLASSGRGTAKQYLLGGTMPSDVQPDKGDLDLVTKTTTIFSQSSRLFLAFQLDTRIDQPRNRLIYAVGPQGFVPKSDHLLTVHSAWTSTTINYVTEHNAPSPSPSPSPLQKSPSTSSPLEEIPPPPNYVGGLSVGRLVAVTVPTTILLLVGLV